MIKHDLVWTFQSRASIRQIFTYLTEAKIRACLSFLQDNGYLLPGNFNHLKLDRTKWYAMTEKALQLFGENNQPLDEITNHWRNQPIIGENNQPIQEIENNKYNIININNNNPPLSPQGEMSAENVFKNFILHDEQIQIPEQKIKEIEKKIEKEKSSAKKEKDENDVVLLDWRNDFASYKDLLRQAYYRLLDDVKYKESRIKFYPGISYEKTLEKMCVDYWATEQGWKKCKKRKSKEIDLVATLKNGFGLASNRVYLSKSEKSTTDFENSKYGKLLKNKGLM